MKPPFSPTQIIESSTLAMHVCITTVVFLLTLIVASTNAKRQQSIKGFLGNGYSSTPFVTKHRLQGDVKSSLGMSACAMLKMRGGEVLEVRIIAWFVWWIFPEGWQLFIIFVSTISFSYNIHEWHFWQIMFCIFNASNIFSYGLKTTPNKA